MRSTAGRRLKAYSENGVRHIGSKFPRDHVDDIDLVATIRASIPYQRRRKKNGGRSLSIEIEDIREKLRKKKIPFATVFVIDSSGSMSRRKMEGLKGAAIALIQDSYYKRDKIGLIAFRNHQAQRLLPLCSRSHFKVAMEYIRDIPSGGGTPLASGLLKAARLLISEKKRRAALVPLIVLMSDGKANVPTSNRMGITDEIKMVCKKIRNEGMLLVFIDTEIKDSQTTTKNYEAVRKLLKEKSWSYYHVSDFCG